METKTYSLRLNETDKETAEEVFNNLGMNFATGINIYLKTVGRLQKIPFSLDMNEKTAGARLQKAFKALQDEAKQNGIDDMSMDEINAEIAAHRQEKRGLNA